MRLKGVVLAGGTGSRLFPLTRVTNKHLLPVYDRPMVFYPIQTLVDAGITDILLVTGGHSAGDFLRLLRNGKYFGLQHLSYAYQEGEGGIADALRLAEHFADGQPICVVLGDNIIETNIIEGCEKCRIRSGSACRYLNRDVLRGLKRSRSIRNRTTRSPDFTYTTRRCSTRYARLNLRGAASWRSRI